MEDTPLKFTSIKSDEIDELADFVHENFSKHGCEPMQSMLTNRETGYAIQKDLLKFHISKYMAKTPETTLAIRDENTNELLAVIINSIEKGENEDEAPDFSKLDDHTKYVFVNIFRLLIPLGGKEFVKSCKGEKVWYSHIGCTSSGKARCGLGTKLRSYMVDVAREKGCRFVISEATGLGTQKIYQRLGFRVENEVFYEDFEVFKGKKEAEIHKCVKLLVLDLEK